MGFLSFIKAGIRKGEEYADYQPGNRVLLKYSSSRIYPRPAAELSAGEPEAPASSSPRFPGVAEEATGVTQEPPGAPEGLPGATEEVSGPTEAITGAAEAVCGATEEAIGAPEEVTGAIFTSSVGPDVVSQKPVAA
ncbi:hypothetical protein GCM10022406_38070 [Hymenobacter algoricola]|uniref:Uncharacterized protein n=1 Tax=Hymenobacter algoricola TaxID=486267 RepID=A0ABP7NRM6_9BACT